MEKPHRCYVASAPSPRVYVYKLSGSMCNSNWRFTRALEQWVRDSIFYEADGDCADYFLVPCFPSNDWKPFVGDANVARLIGSLRDGFPYWNRTAAAGEARHFWMLPCDHGPGDCAYSQPLRPFKYVQSPLRPRRASMGELENYLRTSWGAEWESLNPASPSRLIFFLTYNGWADGVSNANGVCRNCFMPGLDIRLPTPDGHECGPLCGLHFHKGVRMQEMLQRYLLADKAVVGPRKPRRGVPQLWERTARNCTLYWAGAERQKHNAERVALVGLAGAPGVCVRNTLTHDAGPSIPDAMRTSRFCAVPKGWDLGDSDRYLPALLYGCVPVVADPIEVMPFQEHPDMAWDKMALFVSRQNIPKLPALLAALPASAEKRMLVHASRAWPRLLHTTVVFAGTECHDCALSNTRSANCRRSPSDERLKGTPSLTPEAAAVEEARSADSKQSRAPDASWMPPKSQRQRDKERKLVQKAMEQADKLGINISEPDKLCGRSSYLGEDGSRDSYHTLMEVLAQRLSNGPTPVEPWACVQSGSVASGGAGACPTSAPTQGGQISWFGARASWYNEQLRKVGALQPVPFVPVAHAHRQGAEVVGRASRARRR